MEGVDQWWNGPKWLATSEEWPPDVVNEVTEESQAEAKLVRKVPVAIDEENEIDNILRKFQLQKAVRLCACMRRFVHNSLRSQGRPCIRDHRPPKKQAQKSCEVEKDRVALNLQLNQNGLLECRGRLQGDYPVWKRPTSSHCKGEWG